jgi:ABC-type dipeptide/oligopeptide/nickel transport system permease component
LPLVEGAVLLLAGSFVFINLLVDLMYGYLDPRVRLQ